MAGTPSRSDRAIADALREAHGLQTVAARRLDISHASVRRAISRSPMVMEAWRESREKLLDLAEGQLYKAIAAGEAWAIRYVLSTIGRHRGYTERLELVVDRTRVERLAAEEGCTVDELVALAERIANGRA